MTGNTTPKKNGSMTIKQWIVLIVSGAAAGSGGGAVLPVMAPEIYVDPLVHRELREIRDSMRDIDKIAHSLWESHQKRGVSGPAEVRKGLEDIQTRLEAHSRRCEDELIEMKTVLSLCMKK